jgi:7-cyano-7-deazaguanine synthase
MRNNQAKRAVVLLSGGLDSAVTLFFAKAKGFLPFALIFDYGQRHKKEINCAKKIARSAGCPYKILKIDLPWKGSSLLDKNIRLRGSVLGVRDTKEIPSTYVPARNTIFLSFALSFAEAINARAIFIGAHAQDYSGYPDCRPEYFKSFSKVIEKGTKAGVEGRKVRIITPLINKTKAGIIRLGYKLGVPFGLTWSCYKGGKKPCGVCDSCYYRNKGFKEAGTPFEATQGHPLSQSGGCPQ